MPQLPSVLSYLDSLLDSRLYEDRSLNGLQVEAVGTTEIRKVAAAVDSGLSIIEKAVEAEADLLIVHHGLFWGEQQPITGALAKKIALLQKKRCSLYASHLPLDGNSEVGNGYELGRYLELQHLENFCMHRGMTIGAKGSFEKGRPLEYFSDKLSQIPGYSRQTPLFFGPKNIHTVGIVTGAGSFAITLCPAEGIDLLITGEPKQEAYHLAKDLGVNVLFAGHYATETFGVRALLRRLQRDFDVESYFIDESTGI
jgi:dinuclear metal center YbgI/SA1388 family protein